MLTPGSAGAVDRGRREHVVAGDLHRPGGVADVDHRAQRHHVAVGVADLELLDGLRVHAEGGVGLDVDLPGAAEAVEVVDVVAAQVHLQRVEDVGQRHAHRLGPCPVDVHVELRRAGAEAVEQADQAGLLVALGGQVVGLGLQRVEVDVAGRFHHQLEAAGVAQAVHRRRPEDEHAGLRDLALKPLRGAGPRWRRRSATGPRRSWNGLRMTNMEPKFELMAFRTNDSPGMASVWATPGVSRAIFSTCVGHLDRALQRGRVGQLDVDHQVALVLDGDEPAGDAA